LRRRRGAAKQKTMSAELLMGEMADADRNIFDLKSDVPRIRGDIDRAVNEIKAVAVGVV